ncbi:Ig-like domain-containing protein [Acidaminobacter hydrogenoformans]|uniref:SLH domain-containing protein n=1 Tax=Acidaminobacter hydrogenoformans DSM 2784 TaxID=1120920 RepID=A0A1G5RZY7_9FIRM|nr:Ig-like domain-containing protein [Acidaminobacter hydrogenoformans]SCZ79041.1 hypothetical protein SAMN03080599_01563 [Acidaminobacter hydrogenoformans DSM 2784]
MKRLISMLLVLILAMGIIPTGFAAEMTAGETLRSLGLVVGYEDGDLAEDEFLTRTEMMVILARMLGEYNEAFRWTRQSTFSDRSNHWGERYVAYAQYKGWTAGIGDNKFGYEQKHTVQEASVFMLKALGYTAPADFTWETAYTKAKALGLFEGLSLRETNSIYRGQLFETMLNTLLTDMKGQTYMLGQKLDVLTPDMIPFEVEDVSSNNLREIKVVFSKEVDEDTLSSSDFSISGRTATPELQNDGVTVILELSSALSNDTRYSLTISGIRSEDGTSLSRVTKTFTSDDDIDPELERARLLGPAYVELTFSEPIKTAGTVQVYDGRTSYTSSASFAELGSDTIIVRLSKALVNNRTYEFRIKSFRDYAGNYSDAEEVDLIYKPASYDPTAKIIKATQTYVHVEFSDVVSGLTKAHFYHTSTAKVPLGIYSNAAMTTAISTSTKVEDVYVKFADASGSTLTGNPLPSGSATVYIKELGASNVKIVDEYGNAYLGGSYSVTVTADTTKPSVTKLSVSSSSSTSTKLAIEFSESVKFSGTNIEVRNPDDSVITGLSVAVTGSGNVYSANLTGVNLTGKSIEVTIRNVEDLAIVPNVLTSYSKTLSVADSTAPRVTEVRQDTSKKELYVTFSEPVTSATALNEDNYVILSGSTTDRLNNNPVFISGETKVKLSLTDSEFTLSQRTGADLRISGIKDYAGNTMSTYTLEFDDIEDLLGPAPEVEGAEAVDLNTVKVTFDQKLTTVDIDAFKILIGSTEYAPDEIQTSTNSAGDTVVLLTSPRALPYDATDVKLKIDSNATDRILENGDGQLVADVTVSVEDKIAPALDVIEGGDHDGEYNVTIAGDKISIVFTESIKASSVTTSTFKVSAGSITAVGTNGSIVSLTLNNTPPSVPTVTQSTNVLDGNNNPFRTTETLTPIQQ